MKGGSAVPTEVDVAIVGGGPSGSAAAHYLAQRGHSVLVCEKKSFPREKTCGDGLTPRAVKVLQEMGLQDELDSWERVDGLRVHAAGKTLELDFPSLDDFGSYGLVKPRKDLDRIVLDHAEAQGAKVLYDTEVKEPTFDRGVVDGFTATRGGLGRTAGQARGGDTEAVRSKFVISGEGAATKFTRQLARDRDPGYPMGLAIRQYFTSPMQSSGWFEAYLDVRSAGDSLPAYGWVFPVGDGTVNAGVGLLSTYGAWRDVNLNRLQDAFIGGLPPEWEINAETVCSKPRAGRLFMGGSVRPPHGPGFLLTGDAAGFINPCNGEGIAYAYETGRIAARHVDEALRGGSSPTLDGYTDELRQIYGPYYRLGRRFVKLIGYPWLMEKLVSIGMNSATVMSFALTMLGNLEDGKATNQQQRLFKALKMIAELKPGGGA
jgi:geranylgeranyl reductase family protein